MSANWLHGLHHDSDQPDQPQAMPVFEGQKLVAVGGSSGMGRDTACGPSPPHPPRGTRWPKAGLQR